MSYNKKEIKKLIETLEERKKGRLRDIKLFLDNNQDIPDDFMIDYIEIKKKIKEWKKELS